MSDVFDRCGDPALKFAKSALFKGFAISFDMMNYCAFGDSKPNITGEEQQAQLEKELSQKIYPELDVT